MHVATRLPELLRQVRAGKQCTSTNRSEAVADLVPCETGKPKDKVAAVENFISSISPPGWMSGVSFHVTSPNTPLDNRVRIAP